MRSYFAAPNMDCRPDGPAVLGSILSDPLDPEESLNKQPLPIPEGEISTSDQNNFEQILSDQKKLSGGLWFRFLELLGIQVGGSNESSNGRIAKFDKLETRTFQPSDDYVKNSIAVPDIQKHLAGRGATKLYMITGVKIAYGATVKEAAGTSRSVNMFLGIDGTAAAGLPLGVGSAVGRSNETTSTTQFDKSMPFVFAYRLRQIRYRRRDVSHRPYRDGALYGVTDGEAEEVPARRECEVDEIVFLELDEDDVTGDDVGAGSLEVSDGVGYDDSEDDEDGCELVLPRAGRVVS